MDPAPARRPLPPSNPEFFGPLDGAAGAIAKRERLRDAVAAAVVPLLADGEQILHVARAIHVPPLLHQMGLGWWWYASHRVALVLTDRRIVEVLLDHRGRGPDTRLLSYPWSGTRSLKIRFLMLVLRPRTGRVQKWRLERGDRKLLRRLVPLIVQRRLEVSGEPTPGPPRPVPLWHCPACAADLEAGAPACAACGVRFTSPRFATWLSVAFPGGGLFYTGHPVLGAFDLVGEVVLALFVTVLLLTSPDAATTIAAFALGAFFLLATKLESVHLSRIFASRTRPVTEARTSAWRRFALAGTACSVLAIALPLPFVGSLANRIDRDLTFTEAQPAWTGGLEPTQWQHGLEPDQRSEWIYEDGQVVFVFAYPLGTDEGLGDMRQSLLGQKLAEPLAGIEIAGLSGFRAVDQVRDGDGETIIQVRYFLLDAEMHDMHVLTTYSPPGIKEAAERDLRALLAAAEWAPATR